MTASMNTTATRLDPSAPHDSWEFVSGTVVQRFLDYYWVKHGVSPGTLKVPDDVKLKSVDLTVSLESLSFYLEQGDFLGRA